MKNWAHNTFIFSQIPVVFIIDAKFIWGLACYTTVVPKNLLMQIKFWKYIVTGHHFSVSKYFLFYLSENMKPEMWKATCVRAKCGRIGMKSAIKVIQVNCLSNILSLSIFDLTIAGVAFWQVCTWYFCSRGVVPVLF